MHSEPQEALPGRSPSRGGVRTGVTARKPVSMDRKPRITEEVLPNCPYDQPALETSTW